MIRRVLEAITEEEDIRKVEKFLLTSGWSPREHKGKPYFRVWPDFRARLWYGPYDKLFISVVEAPSYRRMGDWEFDAAFINFKGAEESQVSLLDPSMNTLRRESSNPLHTVSQIRKGIQRFVTKYNLRRQS